MLHDEFEIRHTTLQFEVGSGESCGVGDGCTAPAEAPRLAHQHA
jgi:cobalt-zinc-cadmium efflux system protein